MSFLIPNVFLMIRKNMLRGQNWSKWKHSVLPQPLHLSLPPPPQCGNCSSLSLSFSLAFFLSLLPPILCSVMLSHSLSTLFQRGAHSDRCNTVLEGWAELAGCTGHTRASSPDWRKRAKSGRQKQNKTVVVEIGSAKGPTLPQDMGVFLWALTTLWI